MFLFGTNPNDSADDFGGVTGSGGDTDGDGITDNDELACVSGFCTDPNLFDTDGDGLSDLDEINGGGHPFAFASDPTVFDTDGDGANDFTEALNTTDPQDPTSF